MDDDCDGADICSDTGDRAADSGGDTAEDSASADTASPTPPPEDEPREESDTGASAPGPIVMLGLFVPLWRRRRG